jgi:DNA modification methylase
MIEELISGKRRYQLLQGNCLSLLRSLPDNIIQCCITSPPYWGLRSYGTAPQIWGGAADCQHDWAQTAPRRLRTEKDVKNPNTIQKNNVGANHALDFTETCKKCAAWNGELGHESTPEHFVANLTDIFREVRRVLRPDGVCWINIADSYHSSSRKRVPGGATKPQDEPLAYRGKNMALVPQKLAISLQEDGWFVRSEVIWHKLSCMPESASDRCTRTHEQIWMVTKQPYYFYDQDAIREPHKEESVRRLTYSLESAIERSGGHLNKTQDPGKFCHPAGANKRDVWTLSHTQFEGEHYAGFPLDLPKLCILASTSEKGRCADCGTPYKRMTERNSLERFDLDESDPRYRPARYDSKYDAIRTKEGNGQRFTEVISLGFAKSCKCQTEEVLPCIVLDPFSGSGTTGLVGLQLGRSYLGLELNEAYIKMTEQRFDGGSTLLELMNG